MSSLTSSNAASVQPPVRPEYERQLESPGALAAAQPLSVPQRLWAQPVVRRVAILAVLAALWQLLATWQDNDLLLPTFTQTLQALWEGVASGELLDKARGKSDDEKK